MWGCSHVGMQVSPALRVLHSSKWTGFLLGGSGLLQCSSRAPNLEGLGTDPWGRKPENTT